MTTSNPEPVITLADFWQGMKERPGFWLTLGFLVGLFTDDLCQSLKTSPVNPQVVSKANQ